MRRGSRRPLSAVRRRMRRIMAEGS